MGSRFAAPIKALDAKATLNVVSDWIPAGQGNKIVAWIEWGVGTGAGVVKLQGGPSNTYTGTPEDLATFTFASASAFDTDMVEKTMPFVRLKITTGVTGGTVDGYIDILD